MWSHSKGNQEVLLFRDTNGVSGWAIIRFWQHSTANHSRHSSRLIGPPLTATEEWKDAGRERINGSL